MLNRHLLTEPPPLHTTLIHQEGRTFEHFEKTLMSPVPYPGPQDFAQIFDIVGVMMISKSQICNAGSIATLSQAYWRVEHFRTAHHRAIAEDIASSAAFDKFISA